uniref:DUF7662 domain-containing protein n=1 Tax=Paenibacillus sp. FSL H8-0537 TaxID=2921399 RepID=UPI004053B933
MLQKLTNALGTNVTIPTTEKQCVTEKANVSEQVIGKYASLYHYIRIQTDETLTLSLEQIEAILGFKLPASALKYRAWWSNDLTHSQAKAWLYADRVVDTVSLPSIIFRKNDKW